MALDETLDSGELLSQPLTEHGRALELENIRLRLEKVERLLELNLRMACPVCRSALLAEVHPDWHDHVEVIAKANGAHGQ